jgi:hypothetical protein
MTKIKYHKYTKLYEKGHGFCRHHEGRQLSSRFDLGVKEALLRLGKDGAGGAILGLGNASRVWCFDISGALSSAAPASGTAWLQHPCSSEGSRREGRSQKTTNGDTERETLVLALTDAEGAVAQRGRRGKVVVDTAGAASPRDVGVLRLRMGLGGELAVLASSALRRGLVQSDTEGVVTAGLGVEGFDDVAAEARRGRAPGCRARGARRQGSMSGS